MPHAHAHAILFILNSLFKVIIARYTNFVSDYKFNTILQLRREMLYFNFWHVAVLIHGVKERNRGFGNKNNKYKVA